MMGATTAVPMVPAIYPAEPVRIAAPLLWVTTVNPVAAATAPIVADAPPAAPDIPATVLLWLGGPHRVSRRPVGLSQTGVV